MMTTLVGTPFLISWLRAHAIGQPIREEGPKGHLTKAGTPTMGGLAIVGGAVLGYLLAHLRGGAVFTWGGLLTMGAIVFAGVVGGLDDALKIRNARNLGLTARTKMLGLLLVAVLFAWLAVALADVSTELSFTRIGTPGIELGPWVWGIWAVLLLIGFANAVNLTDGLDGLAGGSAAFSYSAYVVIAFW